MSSKQVSQFNNLPNTIAMNDAIYEEFTLWLDSHILNKENHDGVTYPSEFKVYFVENNFDDETYVGRNNNISKLRHSALSVF